MDAGNYYLTTLMNAVTKLGPLVLYVVVGYFLFIKLPFLFAFKVTKNNRPKTDEGTEAISFQKEEGQQKRIFEEEKQEKKERQHKHREEKQEKKKEEPKKPKSRPSPAAELFEFRPGDVITHQELKKRYHKLLRENHPDKVATLGGDFKTLAEKKTKAINSAYQELKKKAS